MGLAPYGEPRYAKVILDHLIDLKADGSLHLNMEYFGFLRGLSMTNSRFEALLEGPPRKPDTPVEQRHADVAASIQQVTNEVLLRLARHAREVTGQRRLCLAGGVALNCVANGLILREKIFEEIWIQPAAGDAGGALGAALAAWFLHEPGNANRAGLEHKARGADAMQGALLGPAFADAEIQAVLDGHGAVYQRLDRSQLVDKTVDLLQQEKVIGWFQGRMEFGPRALGNRSIIGDPRSARMQSVMNLKVKFRESFRPFAPVVKRERVSDYFDLNADSPYMLLVAPVRESLRTPTPASGGLDRINQVRSAIPAVTHIDYSARVQTMSHDQNPLFYELLCRFEKATGCAVLVNTSFNVRGEPVVCSPDDAYRCFVNTEMDYLAIGSFLLDRKAQPHQRVARTHDPVPD